MLRQNLLELTHKRRRVLERYDKEHRGKDKKLGERAQGSHEDQGNKLLKRWRVVHGVGPKGQVK